MVTFSFSSLCICIHTWDDSRRHLFEVPLGLLAKISRASLLVILGQNGTVKLKLGKRFVEIRVLLPEQFCNGKLRKWKKK